MGSMEMGHINLLNVEEHFSGGSTAKFRSVLYDIALQNRTSNRSISPVASLHLFIMCCRGNHAVKWVNKSTIKDSKEMPLLYVVFAFNSLEAVRLTFTPNS
jgi:hypothetical protein